MSLEERIERLQALFEKGPVKRTYGIELSFNGNGQAILDMPYKPDFDNSVGRIHGGVFATLMDYAGWFTVAAKYRHWLALVDLQIQLLEPAEKAHLRSIGELVRAGQRLAMARMEVRIEEGRLVAVGSGTFAVTSLPM